MNRRDFCEWSCSYSYTPEGLINEIATAGSYKFADFGVLDIDSTDTYSYFDDSAGRFDRSETSCWVDFGMCDESEDVFERRAQERSDPCPLLLFPGGRSILSS